MTVVCMPKDQNWIPVHHPAHVKICVITETNGNNINIEHG